MRTSKPSVGVSKILSTETKQAIGCKKWVMDDGRVKQKTMCQEKKGKSRQRERNSGFCVNDHHLNWLDHFWYGIFILLHLLPLCMQVNKNKKNITDLGPALPSAESWLPASLPTDLLEGDMGAGTK